MNFINFNLLSLFILSSFYVGANVNKGLNFVDLSVGIEKDYKLPISYRKEVLKFEGNYRKFTNIVYNKKQNKIRFKPRKAGFSVMLIKNKQNKILKRITVDIKNTVIHRVAREVGALLTTLDGIEIKTLNNKIFIDGQIYLPKDMDRIQSVIQQYSPHVVSLVSLSPDAQNNIARLIQKEIANPEITVRAIYNKFILEGYVNSEEEKKRIEFIAHLYTEYDIGEGEGVGTGAIKKKGIARVINRIEVREKKQPVEKKKLVRVTTHYVGLKKDYTKSFLFQWTPILKDEGTQITYQQGLGSLASTVTATINNLFPKLSWAKSFGFARVLHNTTIIMEEGEKGTISTNTQIPVVSFSNGLPTTTKAEVQVRTVVTPTIEGALKNTVSMQLQITVANPAGRDSSGPIITNRNISTKLHVASGQSAVVGGLISSSFSRDFNRTPAGSGGTPLINLISGKGYNTDQSQFIVFITPEIKNSASAWAKRIKEKFKVDEE